MRHDIARATLTDAHASARFAGVTTTLAAADSALAPVTLEAARVLLGFARAEGLVARATVGFARATVAVARVIRTRALTPLVAVGVATLEKATIPGPAWFWVIGTYSHAGDDEKSPFSGVYMSMRKGG